MVNALLGLRGKLVREGDSCIYPMVCTGYNLVQRCAGISLFVEYKAEKGYLQLTPCDCHFRDINTSSRRVHKTSSQLSFAQQKLQIFPNGSKLRAFICMYILNHS